MIIPTLEVIAALVIVAGLYLLGLGVYNRDALSYIRQHGSVKKSVQVFMGVKDAQGAGSESLSTSDPNSGVFKELMLSTNQPGGAEMSWNFWIYMDPDKDANGNFALGAAQTTASSTDPGLTPNDILLFLKGSKQVVTYKSLCHNTKPDVLVKAPLLKLVQGGDELVVEFNTTSSPDAVKKDARNTCRDTNTDYDFRTRHRIGVKNLTKDMFKKKWFMVTVILSDSSDAFSNDHVRARVYVNGVLESDTYCDGRLGGVPANSIRNNAGDLYIFPVLPIGNGQTTKSIGDTDKLLMADLSYFNYTLTPDEITAMARAGFNKNYAPTIAAKTGSVATDISPMTRKKELVAI